MTTPQLVAQRVALRAARMAIGGGGQALAQELGVPLLGRVPLTLAPREHADAGRLLVTEQSGDPAAVAIRGAADRIGALAPHRPLPMAEPVGIPLPVA